MVKKKLFLRSDAPPRFRESDFAGMAPQAQAELSGSLNHLSAQIASTRQLLQALREPAAQGAGAAAGFVGPASTSPPPIDAPADGHPGDTGMPSKP